MENNGLVSVICPSYNCSHLIGDTIRSVQRQSYADWELIVVDDVSTDETDRIVASFAASDPRIRFFRNDVNSGTAVSRNRALREARGRWIAFLDSDDLWEPDKLEKQIRFMEENGHSFSYTEYSEIDEKGRETGVVVAGPSRISRAGMYAFCWPGCLTVMYDASVIGLVQIADIRKNNDYAMWLKVIQKADCYLLPENLAKYRRGRAGSVSSHSVCSMIKWHYKLFREAEKMNVVSSVWHTCVNLVCGFYKKVKYVKVKNS